MTADVSSLPAGEHKIAFTDANDNSIIGWTLITVVKDAEGSPATRNLEAQVTHSVDGEFKLIAPANESPAWIGNAALDATGASVSTGGLGYFAVVDDRAITKKGWDLTANVATFVKGTDQIPNTALGLKPQLVDNAGPGSPVLGPEQIAGSATYSTKFAELAAGSYSSWTGLNAELTFKAPIGSKPGVYNSTLTLTLVSK